MNFNVYYLNVALLSVLAFRRGSSTQCIITREPHFRKCTNHLGPLTWNACLC